MCTQIFYVNGTVYIELQLMVMLLELLICEDFYALWGRWNVYTECCVCSNGESTANMTGAVALPNCVAC